LHRWRARDLAATVGTVFQEPEHQFLTRTVREEVALGPRLRRTLDEAAIDALLDRLRLLRLCAANPFTLSGGEKRRLSVATALATAPAALVLDEPTFGQDAVTWGELLALLGGLRDQGSAVLAVTHDQDFAAALADRHLVMPC
jgi:energy-coupling factor transport system ATP-binding protein